MPKSETEYNRGASVLVVEDNDNDRALLLIQLRRGGLAGHVEFIDDGLEAWEYLTTVGLEFPTGQLIALFLDLSLPGLGGIELLRRIREHERYVNLPVMVMTSSNHPADLEECQRLKVAHYLTKPVSFGAFSKAVADAFDSHSSDGSPPSVPSILH